MYIYIYIYIYIHIHISTHNTSPAAGSVLSADAPAWQPSSMASALTMPTASVPGGLRV